jgi:hypothetical protein
MIQSSRRATLVISIDLRCENRLALATRKNMAAAATTLMGLLADGAINATWGVEFPAEDSWALALSQRHTGHEIALLGDSTWVGPAAPRAQFAAELARRVTAARAVSVDISSLLLADTDLRRDLDIAVKHGLTAVRPCIGRDSGTAATSLRYGLWRIPAALSLTEPDRGILRRSTRSIVRVIDTAVATQRLCHLAIDAGQITTAQERKLRAVFAHIARQRIAGRLVTETLGGASLRQTNPRIALAPARSILREAA